VTEQPHLIVLNGKQPPLTTFPSFHTTVGVLATIACLRIPRFGIAFALFNLCWALAIPVWGSHYFIDMIAGALIGLTGFGLAIALQSLADRSRPHRTGA
jgi:membrane-associated phospholipid phosphatase